MLRRHPRPRPGRGPARGPRPRGVAASPEVARQLPQTPPSSAPWAPNAQAPRPPCRPAGTPLCCRGRSLWRRRQRIGLQRKRQVADNRRLPTPLRRHRRPRPLRRHRPPRTRPPRPRTSSWNSRPFWNWPRCFSSIAELTTPRCPPPGSLPRSAPPCAVGTRWPSCGPRSCGAGRCSRARRGRAFAPSSAPAMPRPRPSSRRDFHRQLAATTASGTSAVRAGLGSPLATRLWPTASRATRSSASAPAALASARAPPPSPPSRTRPPPSPRAPPRRERARRPASWPDCCAGYWGSARNARTRRSRNCGSRKRQRPWGVHAHKCCTTNRGPACGIASSRGGPGNLSARQTNPASAWASSRAHRPHRQKPQAHLHRAGPPHARVATPWPARCSCAA
mmetsp:Transcript_129981/g.417229  ORF Transcript_129981/g.417229 Transcript_129981/m.417229 type:complete len:393 (+) Transcript_129981:186-1364(+)